MYVEFKWYKNNLKIKEICNLNVLRILIPEEDQLNTPLTGATLFLVTLNSIYVTLFCGETFS